MPEIKVKHVVSFSSEDAKFPAANLLKHEGTAKWRCAGSGEKSVSAVLQFEKACHVNQIDIGNDGAAFIEVLVGRSSQGEDEYQVALVASSFMSPQESRGGQNPNRVRMFTEDKLSKAVLSEKWDRVKVVCTQPFNKTSPYGLCFINFHSPPDGTEEEPALKKQKTLGAFKIKSEDAGTSDLKPGALFSQAKEKKPEVPLTGAAAVRAASKAAETMLPSTSHVTPKPEVSRSEHKPEVSRTPSHHRGHTGEASSLKRKHSDDHRPKTPDSQKAVKVPSRDRGASSSHDTPPLRKHSSSSAESSSKRDTPTLKKARSDPSGSKKERPFHLLMKNVTFVMSGFQNPYRGELRDKALEMGAVYKPDWCKGCTHLICAFANTPKFQAVKGQGRIVKKDWINDCHKHQKALPWRKYRLGNAPSPAASSAEESEGEEEPPKKKIQKSPVKAEPKNDSQGTYGGSTDESGGDTDDEIERVKRQNEAPKPAAASTTTGADPYDVDTDHGSDGEGGKTSMVTNGNGVADADSDGELPPLPDFFKNVTFFLYGNFDANQRRRLYRYIIAYKGRLEEYMGDKVTHVLTNSGWDENFDEAVSENSSINFVKPAWVISCHDKQKLLPYQRFMVVPS